MTSTLIDAMSIATSEPAGARIPYDSCPLCGGQDAEQVGIASCVDHPLYVRELPASMRWIRCDACRHVFVDGYFTDAAQALLLSHAHPSQLPGPDTAEGRPVAAKIIEDVSIMRGDWGGRWLDVGFGNGALLSTAAEFGYAAVGLDLRERGVARMRELGFDARCADLADFADPEGFDVISMADVVEHMPFPKKALGAARGLLRPGGMLFVSMPNTDSFAWKALDREGRNPYWGEIEHYHNFDRPRLYELLREFQFSPRRYAISHRYVACMEVVAQKNGA